MARKGEARDARVWPGSSRRLAAAALAVAIGVLTPPSAGAREADLVAKRAAAPCAADPAQFGAGSWPPACWRPYGDASPFNLPLRESPGVAERSAQIVRSTLESKDVQAFVVGYPHRSVNDFGHPVYYSDFLDPVYRVRCARWVRHCEVEGKLVHIPWNAVPAGGTDAHMAVVDAASRWEYDFWEVRTVPLPRLGGTIVIGHGGRTPWGTQHADGLGSNATAAHFGLSAGVIRAEEWKEAALSGRSMNHALFAAVSCTNGHSVYPAAPGTHGTICRRGRDAAPPLGTRYQLNMSNRQIEALGAPGWKTAILKTLARYGMITGDTIGGNRHAFGLVSESDTQYTAFGHSGRFAEFGRTSGVPMYDGGYVFDFGSGVGWRKHLRVVKPCASRGTC